jgi:hypothetical protein
MVKHSWLRTWWWTATFCLLIAGLYGQGMKKQNASLREVTLRFSEIEHETLLAMEEKENLSLRLASQSDPAWIELVLLRQMGVVPDGFLKVHFKR